jgi:hypothetical protein
MCRFAVVLAVSGECVPGLEQRPAAQPQRSWGAVLTIEGADFAASSTIHCCNDAKTNAANAVRRTLRITMQSTYAREGP